MNKHPGKIKKLPYYIIFLVAGMTLLSNCKTQDDAIRIRGRAYNFSKSGACLITSDDKCYYIDNLYEWPSKFEERTILVKGKLRIVCDTTRLPPEEEYQRIIGCQSIIASAKYRIAIRGMVKKEYKNDSDQ